MVLYFCFSVLLCYYTAKVVQISFPSKLLGKKNKALMLFNIYTLLYILKQDRKTGSSRRMFVSFKISESVCNEGNKYCLGLLVSLSPCLL